MGTVVTAVETAFKNVLPFFSSPLTEQLLILAAST